jgi:flagellar biosynthetic protein FlhB
MAETEQSERTERPTPKRLEDARKRGEVPRSRDLGAALITLSGGVALYLLGGLVGGHLLRLMERSFSFTPAQAFDPSQMIPALMDAALQGFIGVVPILGVVLAAAVLGPLLIGGWNFSAEALELKWERLDPVAGFGRIFSIRGLIELGKSLARVAVVVTVSIIVLRSQFDEFALLAVEPTRASIAHACALMGMAFIALGGSLALIALIDVPLSLWQHQRSLRMTRQEMRDESKDVEGNPEIRGRVRRVQQEMSRRRMMQEVPTADVILTNPTHYAVALRYDEDRMRAPIVVAKGSDLIALKIREIGTAHRVPIVEAPPLARALHASCDLGDEIPARLYAAVAQVLTYVYQLRTARRRGLQAPGQPRIDLPPEEPGSH